MATPQSIENKAAVATTDDPNSIRDLVDELFNLPRAYPRMPSIIADTVKNRLVQAEILYRQGKKPGVREQDIVDVHNDLVDRFEGPRHSKTTLSQVRTLRMWLALSQPKLMGTGIARQDGGQTINPTMAPVQAAHLLATLIDQKFINPDFQVTPEEWETDSLHRVHEKIAAARARMSAGHGTGQASQGTLRGRNLSADRRREIEETVYPKISALTATDGLQLVEQTLRSLKLD
jgi:hypothetical protein